MYIRARLIAAELMALGIDTNCAPMLDLARPDTHPFLYNRCYGSDPEAVATLGRATARGFLDGGVLPVGKHMPGHGLSRSDSHHDLPVVEASLEELSDLDFAPFRALNDLPMGMTAHIVYADIDPENPATTSPDVVGSVIREEIGFDGLLMTDDLSMKALNGTFRERGEASLAAGCDLLLHCNGDASEMVSVAEAAPELAGKALERAEKAEKARENIESFDPEAGESRLNALIEEIMA